VNYPPVFSLVSNDSASSALLESGGICRCFLFGEAPKQVATPYVVWSMVTGTPENLLDTTPKEDSQLVQLDCWAKTAAEAREVAGAVRSALEVDGYVQSYRGEEIDPESNLFRISFDWSAFVVRS